MKNQKKYLNIDFKSFKSQLQSSNPVKVSEPVIGTSNEEVSIPEQIENQRQIRAENPETNMTIPFGIEDIPVQQDNYEPQGEGYYVPEYDPNESHGNQEGIQQMQYGGSTGNPPTQQDSLNIYNQAIATQNYYNNPVHKYSKPRYISWMDSYEKNYNEALKELSNNKGVIEKNLEEFEKGPDFMLEIYPEWAKANNLNSEEDVINLAKKARDNFKNATNDKHPVYDYVTGALDFAAPPTWYDSRIKPQGLMETASDISPGRAVTIPYYDPIAVKPWSMLTDAERKLRIQKYGYPSQQNQSTTANRSEAINTVNKPPKAPNLNTDLGAWLKTQNAPSSYAGRKKLYEQITGNTDYKGTAEQNIGLLNLLKDKGLDYKHKAEDTTADASILPTPESTTIENDKIGLYYSIGTNNKRKIVFNVGETGKMKEMTPEEFIEFRKSPEFAKYKELNPNPHLYQMLSEETAGYLKNSDPIKFNDGGLTGISNFLNRNGKPISNLRPIEKQSSIPDKEKNIPIETKQFYESHYNNKPISLNPKNWGVKDYTGAGEFNKAYSIAKKIGEKEFMWNGKRYTTDYAGTPRQEVGAYGVNGKPVHPMDINSPAQVNLFSPSKKHRVGHLSASIENNKFSVDYGPFGNYSDGASYAEGKGQKSFYVYGQDSDKFYDKVNILPKGIYSRGEEYNPSTWDLFTNNCADNVCDALDIPRHKGLETPEGALGKIKEKYTTLDITGRTNFDYVKMVLDLQRKGSKDVLKNYKNLIGIASSPEFKKGDIDKTIVGVIQEALVEQGYPLSKSIKKDGSFDGVLGDETKAALLDYQTKNKNQDGGIHKFQDGGLTGISNFLNRNGKPISNVRPIEKQSSVPDKMPPQDLRVLYAQQQKAKEDAIVRERMERIALADLEQQKPFSQQRLSVATGAIGDKFRNSYSPNFYDDVLNPGVWLGNFASRLGRFPKNVSEGKYADAAYSVVEPLTMGAMAGVASKASGTFFLDELFSPFAGMGYGKQAATKGLNNAASSVDDVGRNLTTTPQSWKMQELPGLHLKSTMEGEAISKIVEPKTGLINTEQALAIIGKESGGADKVALIRQALGDNIPKKMDYNKFRKVVQDQLIPLERQFSTSKSNYGIDRIGYSGATSVEENIGGTFYVYGSSIKFKTRKEAEEFLKSHLPLENQTLILGNKSKFGRGSSAHGNPDETLGHAHFLRDAETPDVLTVTQIQSDAFQGTHRTSLKTKEQAKFNYDRQLEYYNKNKDKIEKIKKIDENTYQFPDGQKISKSAYENMFSGLDESLALSKADLENFTQKQLLDKNHQERYLQELVDYAGKRGDINKMRVPTSETAAKVQGYSKTKTGKYKDTISEEGVEYVVNLKNQGKSLDEIKAMAKKENGGNLDYEDEKIISDIFNNAKEFELKYSSEHQTILKKYSEQPKTIKKLFGKEPTIVTDSKGNTWYEFDIPDKFKKGKGEIKAFNFVPPTIGFGLGIGALQQTKDKNKNKN